MQVFQAQLGGADRPCAPRDCPQCAGAQKLLCHGRYFRYREVEGQRQIAVRRFLCRHCGRTWSVIPVDMAPRRPLEVSRFEALMDERCALADGGARPPPATEKEEGCVRRSCQALIKRITFLRGLFGQQLPLFVEASMGSFWRALRQLGPTASILIRLARDFNTSILGCYRSLLPHWQRERRPV